MKNKITIRISDDLRDQLDELAISKRVSTSELSRTILDEYCSSVYSEEFKEDVEDELQIEVEVRPKIDYEEEYNAVKYKLEQLYKENEELANTDIVYSVEFLQLVCWIYYQRSGLRFSLLDEQYKDFQETIIKIHSSKILRMEMKNEFNKVFADLVKVEGNFFLKKSQLDFSKGILPNFNYSLLNDFIYKNKCGITRVSL